MHGMVGKRPRGLDCDFWSGREEHSPRSNTGDVDDDGDLASHAGSVEEGGDEEGVGNEGRCDEPQEEQNKEEV